MRQEFKTKAESLGNFLVDTFHIVALFIIGLTVIWSATTEYLAIITAGHPSLKDILLLFIYLELLAMVGIYFKTKKLPVVFLIYVALTALTRVLTVDIKTMETGHLLAVSGAIFILAVSAWILALGKPKWLRKDSTEENA